MSTCSCSPPPLCYCPLLPTSLFLLQVQDPNDPISECTAKALTHRISALKAKAKLAAGGSTVDPTTPAKAAKGPATPRKRGAAAKKAEAEANGNGTASEGDAEESPKKKVKTNGAGAGGRAAAKGKKKAAPSAPPPSPMAPTTPATPGDLEDGGCKLESEGEEEEG